MGRAVPLKRAEESRIEKWAEPFGPKSPGPKCPGTVQFGLLREPGARIFNGRQTSLNKDNKFSIRYFAAHAAELRD